MSITDQYEHMIAVRNTELETYWTRYNVQVVLNGGLIVVALASPSGSHLMNLPICLVSIGGFALAIVWLIMVHQGKDWIHRWDNELCNFEEQVGENELYPLFTNIKKSKAADDNWRNITYLAKAVPILCAITWLVLLFHELNARIGLLCF